MQHASGLIPESVDRVQHASGLIPESVECSMLVVSYQSQ